MQCVAIADEVYTSLLNAVRTDSGDSDTWSGELAELYKYRVDMTVCDCVVLYRGRVVVPGVLREDVLRNLHRAHQGSTGMGLRAGETVWWPGLTKDLQRVRESCGRCTVNAPSQPAAPPKPLRVS